MKRDLTLLMPSASLIRFGVMMLACIVAAAAGCSDSRNSGFNVSTGRHDSADWLPDGHARAATNGTQSASPSITADCAECHGDDLQGGLAGVSCTSCHLGGPARVHPEAWGAPAPGHAAYARDNGTQACANVYCHGAALEGRASSGPACTSCHLGGAASIHPLTWTTASLDHAAYAAAIGPAGCANASCHGADLNGVDAGGPACSSCHLGGAASAHPADWTNRYTSHGPFTSTNGTAGCSNQACHGPLLTGVQNSGPSCGVCHDWPLAAGAPVTLSCGFCHGVPPNGTVAPNRPGVHAKHLALPGVSCSSCHAGAGGATVNPLHPNLTTEVVIDPVYYSKSGPAAFDAVNKTCSNVSCHGGPRTQTRAQASEGAPAGTAPQSTPAQTPAWYGGLLNPTVNEDVLCFACHTFDPARSVEFNNFGLDRHFFHVYDAVRGPQPKYHCNDCHDTAALLPVNHFTSLATPTMEGPASATLRPLLNYNPATTGCDPGCHVPRVWNPAP